MKGIFVSAINKNSQVEGIFLVKEKHMGITKGGISYLSLKLMDRTGEINARVWEEAVHYDQIFGKDDFINISGRSSVYQGGMQIAIADLKKCREEEIDLQDFLPAAPFPREEMLEELQLIMDDIKDRVFKGIAPVVFCGRGICPAFYDRSSGQGASPCLSGRFNGAFSLDGALSADGFG